MDGSVMGKLEEEMLVSRVERLKRELNRLQERVDRGEDTSIDAIDQIREMVVMIDELEARPPVQSELDIQPGDRVCIKALGITVCGLVHSANHYGFDRNEDGEITGGGWYIELLKANVPGGYSYWKQGIDGGHIISVNDKAV